MLQTQPRRTPGMLSILLLNVLIMLRDFLTSMLTTSEVLAPPSSGHEGTLS